MRIKIKTDEIEMEVENLDLGSIYYEENKTSFVEITKLIIKDCADKTLEIIKQRQNGKM